MTGFGKVVAVGGSHGKSLRACEKEPDVLVLDRIAEIAPILVRTAAESERLRTLCREATEAMHAAGLFGMWVPRDAGGFDIDLVTQVDAIVELARADMSACWTLMIGNTVTASMAASLPAEGFAEVFVGERLPVAAGSLKPSGGRNASLGVTA